MLIYWMKSLSVTNVSFAFLELKIMNIHVSHIISKVKCSTGLSSYWSVPYITALTVRLAVA